jgi:hypothetical protein
VSTEVSSLEAAVRETVIGAGFLGAETTAEQLDLLRDKDGRLPQDAYRQVRSGPGRRPGSTNKLNRKIAQMVVQVHGDPVMELASIGFMPLDQMVETLVIATGQSKIEEKLTDMAERLTAKIEDLQGKASQDYLDALGELADRVFDAIRRYAMKPGDLAEKAMKIKKSALVDVAPYVYGKQPIVVDINKKPDVILNIAGLTNPAALAAMADDTELTMVQLQNMQFLPSHGGPVQDADYSEIADEG